MRRILRSCVAASMLACLCASPSAQADKSRAIEAPFELTAGHVVVFAKVNGTGPYNMLLCTGSNASVIESGLARQMKVAAMPVSVAGGKALPPFSMVFPDLDRVEIGGFEARHVEAVAARLDSLSRRLGIQVHGTLGYSFLRNRAVRIDYARQVISLSAPDKDEQNAGNVPGAASFPFTVGRANQVPVVVGGAINGEPLKIMIDTCSADALSLTPDAARKLGVAGPGAAAAKGEKKESVAGAFMQNSVLLDAPLDFEGDAFPVKSPAKLSLGPVSREWQSFTVFNAGSPRDKGMDVYGATLGNGFLKDFVVTLDYRNKTVTLGKATR